MTSIYSVKSTEQIVCVCLCGSVANNFSQPFGHFKLETLWELHEQ